MLQKYEFFSNSKAEQLLVFLPGMNRAPKHYEYLFKQFKSDKKFSKCDAIGFSFSNSYLSNIEPDQLAIEISDNLQTINSNYQSIILVGHSVGGLLIRKCFITGAQSKSTWITKVERLILLSSTNRGFVLRGFVNTVGMSALKTICRGKLIQHAQRGSGWVNQLRLDWSSIENPPKVVQIRGNEDELVEADDSADLMYFPNACEIKLEGVNHKAFCSPELSDVSIEKIKDAFFDNTLIPTPKSPKKSPSLLVFLVHGIRDYAEWQDALVQEIEEIDPEALVIPVQYGYFNAFQFLFRLQRNRASRIFADKYIQAKLKYPNAKVAIAAHSNGTYAVANAFEEYKFKADRLYLAGSVLPQKFNWTTKNIGILRNDIANTDWPVGFLCNTLKWVDNKIGVAGFRGFTAIDPEKMRNNKYLRGAHGAALAPPYRSEIAKFLVTGKPSKLGVCKVSENKVMEAFSYLAVPLSIAVLVGIGYLYVLIATTLSITFAVIASAFLTSLLIVSLSSL